jgi:hypothetical protein
MPGNALSCEEAINRYCLYRDAATIRGEDLMLRTITLPLVICLLLAACESPRYWHHAAFSQPRFNTDSFECQGHAMSSAPIAMTAFPIYGRNGQVFNIMADANEGNRTNMFNRCMYARGYWLAPAK